MTQEQYNKLDKCYFNYSLEDNCLEEIIDARTLLGAHRFDLYGILFYIDQKVKGVADLSYAKEVYKERTRAMTGFRLSEIGNDNKSSFDDFIIVLDNLIADFQNDRYDYDKTLVPVDKKGEPIDGAHRISCAAYFNKKIKVLHFLEREVTPYDYAYLQHEFLPSDIADTMAIESLKWHDNIFALFLWPKAHKSADKLQKAISLIANETSILYQVEYKLTFEAIKNLMIQLYGHMDWVGSIDDGYANITGKADEVWADNGLVRIVLVQANSCEEVLAIKGKVRDMFSIGLASIHSTDNIRETKMAMNALLNPNSRHHLLNADVTRYKDSYKLFTRFKDIISHGGFDKDEFVLDASMVLSIYGLRPARDLDYYCLHASPEKQYPGGEDIEEHDDTQKSFYSLPIEDLINDPRNFFVYNEIKYVTLRNLLLFKKNRYNVTHEPKDAEDIKLIQSILSNHNKFAKFISRKQLILKRKKRVFNEKLRNNVIMISKELNLYDFLRSIKHLLRK